MNNQYPKTFTHRDDHMSSVVVMNAEQEAQLPVEYLPAVTGEAGQTVSAADNAADVMLSPEYAAVLADREKIEQERTALAEDRAQLEKQRAELTAGYKGAMDALEADRATLNAEIEGFAKTKAGEQPADEPESDASTPAKRGRPSKAE